MNIIEPAGKVGILRSVPTLETPDFSLRSSCPASTERLLELVHTEQRRERECVAAYLWCQSSSSQGMDVLEWMNTNPLKLLFRTCVFKCQSSSSKRMEVLKQVNTDLLPYCSGHVCSSANPQEPENGFAEVGVY